MFPRTVGLTGQCVASQQIIVNDKGDKNRAFRGEIDNIESLKVNFELFKSTYCYRLNIQ